MPPGAPRTRLEALSDANEDLNRALERAEEENADLKSRLSEIKAFAEDAPRWRTDGSNTVKDLETMSEALTQIFQQADL